jgi:hypothetical protein
MLAKVPRAECERPAAPGAPRLTPPRNAPQVARVSLFVALIGTLVDASSGRPAEAAQAGKFVSKKRRAAMEKEEKAAAPRQQAPPSLRKAPPTDWNFDAPAADHLSKAIDFITKDKDPMNAKKAFQASAQFRDDTSSHVSLGVFLMNEEGNYASARESMLKGFTKALPPALPCDLTFTHTLGPYSALAPSGSHR